MFAEDRREASIPTINVMIIGSVKLYCDGLALALDGREDISVIATSTRDAATSERLRSVSPDVVVIDVQSLDVVELVYVIRRECPSIKTVAFAIDEESETVMKCAEAGVSGYVTCDAGVGDLVTVIQTVVRGQFVCPPEIAIMLWRRLASRGETASATAEGDSLTTRERQVLELICEGLSNKEIARACNISEATVKNHVHHLLEKKKLRTRVQLAARATARHVGTTRRHG